MQEQGTKTNVTNMRNLQYLSESLADECRDPELKSELEYIAEEIRYSDPVSCEATAELEINMQNQLENIRQVLPTGKKTVIRYFTDQVMKNLKERNRICMSSKRR